MENCEITEVPEAVSEYQKESMLNQYRSYASMYGMELEDSVVYWSVRPGENSVDRSGL